MTLVPYFEWDLSTLCMFASPVWGPWVVLLRVPLWFSMPLNVMLNVVRFQKCVVDWNDSDSRFVVNVPSVSYVADTACRVCGRVHATVQRLSVCPVYRPFQQHDGRVCCWVPHGQARYRPSHHSATSRCCGWFAAVGPIGRRYWSTAVAAGAHGTQQQMREVSRFQLP